MYMYIYLCVVQCNGVKASPLSEIWLQSINHFHQCQPLLSAGFSTHSFRSPYGVICQKTVPNYYSISSCNRNPVSCMFSSHAFMHAPSLQRAAISLLPLLAWLAPNSVWNRHISIFQMRFHPNPGITIYVSANTIIATKSEIWSCATECYSDVCCLLMVLISSVVLEGGLHAGSSDGRIESVANFVVLYLDFAHEKITGKTI